MNTEQKKPTKCVLIVEDDEVVARATSRWLARFGIHSVRASTMSTARRIIQEGTDFIGVKCEIGAVITDWQFPFRDDDGRGPRDGAGELVYRDAQEKGLPVAVMSGREDGPIRGFEPWIVKPDVMALTAWIQTVLPTL